MYPQFILIIQELFGLTDQYDHDHLLSNVNSNNHEHIVYFDTILYSKNNILNINTDHDHEVRIKLNNYLKEILNEESINAGLGLGFKPADDDNQMFEIDQFAKLMISVRPERNNYCHMSIQNVNALLFADSINGYCRIKMFLEHLVEKKALTGVDVGATEIENYLATILVINKVNSKYYKQIQINSIMQLN